MHLNPHRLQNGTGRRRLTALFTTLLICLVCGIGVAGKTGQKHSVASAIAAQHASAPVSTPVTVGSLGNEPVLALAPDGTLYISALQHFYRSTDNGATWTNLPGPPESNQLNLASD